jgi:hypothetical protein
MFRILATCLAGSTLALCAGAPASAGSRQPRTGTASAKAINPGDFVKEVNNPFYPLTPGTTLRYRGEKDGKPAIDVLEVTHLTKKIEGVVTVVVHDKLFLAGRLHEVTTDWYAQDRHGNVWYFGEATKTLKPGGKLESTEGSFQAGVRGARAGVFFPGNPRIGVAGQQEFSRGQAEDHFTVLSLSATVSVPFVTSSRAVRTKEFTPLEPKVLDNKYYVSGIGTVLEVALKGPPERLELFARETH